MCDRRDDRPLLILHRRLRGAAHVIEHLEVRADRHVVPRHEPEAGHVERHVVVPQAALAPRVRRGLALLHHAAGLDRHAIGEDAARAADALEDVLGRQMPERLVPIDRRHPRREIEEPRGRDQILARRVFREHRPHLVLFTVNPGDEQHLHRAAAIPVALFPIRTDLADAGAETLHVHRRITRSAERCDRWLPLRRRRASRRAKLAVRPRLLRQVFDRFVAVGDRRAENVVVAFREKMTALVLADVGVAFLDGLDDARHVGRHAVAHVPEVEVVGGLDENDGHPARRVLRTINIRHEAHAVLHRDHHAPFDDGDVLQFGLEILAALLLRRCERALLR